VNRWKKFIGLADPLGFRRLASPIEGRGGRILNGAGKRRGLLAPLS
jgi:hypothetical protein